MEVTETSIVPLKDTSSLKADEGYNSELVFNKYKAKLITTLDGARKVKHYENIPPGNHSTVNYSAFKNFVPITSSDDFSPPEDFIDSRPETMYKETSGGSSGGKLKEIYYPLEGLRSTVAQSVINELNKAQRPTLLHKETETTSYHIIEESLKSQAPKVSLTTYLPASEVVNKIRGNDVVYITEQVSKLREIMHEFEKQAAESPEQLAEALKGKKFFLELVAEPIEIEEVKKWHEFFRKYTGKDPGIWAIYGTAETLMIGFWAYDPGQDRIRYKVKDNKFVEVLGQEDNNTVSSNADKGRIIVTPTHPVGYKGTKLLRYETGDLAKVEIEGDEMYLSEIERRPDAGMISLWGEKIFVPQIQQILQTELGRPIIMRTAYKTVKSAELSREQVVLDFDIYSSDFSDAKNSEDAKKRLLEVLIKTYDPIQELLNAGKLVININSSTDTPKDLIKAWKIIR